MDILRRKYEDLIAKEADIKKDMSRVEGQRKRPREDVLLWLEHVETVKKQVTEGLLILEEQFAEQFPDRPQFLAAADISW
ncbi:hypothetical protein IFM89_035808 [Coptis chinensis]|uniref:Uncharacterized protein n=1 Tax=Coptis chinensis TaxID=261450 RepID=A0A835I8A9_9MAGN|nr:hypothetical protein IFM89_035808 [Coptis chinensis]